MQTSHVFAQFKGQRLKSGQRLDFRAVGPTSSTYATGEGRHSYTTAAALLKEDWKFTVLEQEKFVLAIEKQDLIGGFWREKNDSDASHCGEVQTRDNVRVKVPDLGSPRSKRPKLFMPQPLVRIETIPTLFFKHQIQWMPGSIQ